MAELVLPETKDVKGVIADYLDILVADVSSRDEREKIIANCEKSFALLINAWEIIDSRGEVEKKIWNAFIQDIAFDWRVSRYLLRVA